MAGRFVLPVMVLVLLGAGISGVAAETYCFDAAMQDNGLFNEPTDIAVDSAGTTFVADRGLPFVVRLDTAGTLSIIPPQPPYYPRLAFPRGVAADGDRVFVAETGNRSVQVFSPDGIPLGSWDSVAGQFFLKPVGMGLDPCGRVYVADCGTNSVEAFFPNGTPFLRLESGLGAVNLSSPMDVAVNSTGCIFVADASHHAVRFFMPNGTGFDAGGWGEAGQNHGQFRFPNGIAIDCADNVYVADRDNHRIQKFTADGAFVAKWGTVGSLPGDLRFPEGVAVDGNGTVFVSDTGNSRVQRFRLLLPVPGSSGNISTSNENVMRYTDVNGNGRSPSSRCR